MRIAVLFLLLLAGCSNLHQVDRHEFMQKAAGPTGTLQMSKYVGSSWDRAYVQDWQMGLFSSRTRVLWTPLKELSAGDRAQLEAIKSAPALQLTSPVEVPPSTPTTRPADDLRL